jgi:hypothetical protein
MNNALTDITTSLDTNLNDVDELLEVLFGRSADFSAFPAARHYLVGLSDDVMDTATNYRTYKIGIDIVMPYAVEGQTKAMAEAALQAVVGAVCDKLNATWYDTVDHSMIEIGAVQLTESQQGPLAMMSLIWNAKTLVTI